MVDESAWRETLRSICMAFLEVEEVFEGSVGDPVYKTNGKIFAMQHSFEGRPSVWCKAPPGVQEAQIAIDPARFFRPPYVGQNGWVGIRIDEDSPWPVIADLIDDSWRMTAKKRVIAAFDATPQEEETS